MNTFADPLRHALLVAAGKVAVIDGESRFTYRQFADRCARLAGGLSALGLGKGDRVAILAANGHAFLETYVGVPAGGFVVVPLNTRHAQSELEYTLRDSGARVLVTDRPPGALAGLVEHVLPLGAPYEDLLAGSEPAELGAGVTEDDLAGLFYTGGTTGASKGVMLTHRNLIANTYHWLTLVPQYESDVVLVMAPLFHAAGSNGVLGALWTAGTQVPLPAFDPGVALDLIAGHGVTATLGVPTMLAALANEQHERPRDTRTLRLIGHGGSPIATEVLRRCCTEFPTAEFVEVYGATELSPLATVLVGERALLDHPRARSCGRPVAGGQVRVVDLDGRTLPPGEVGEVVVRGPQVMRGYWNKPEQTAKALRGGEYWSGDLGYMDTDGYLFLVDRAKDMIISGGENVYSTEVEDVLYRHPGVLEVAVFGVPDDTWGEVVHAVVVPRAGYEGLDPAELIAFCRDRIAHYKAPRGIDLRSEPLPKSGPGKVLKRELRAPFWKGQDRNVH
jgi:long-chain acyl-CoA synthetase